MSDRQPAPPTPLGIYDKPRKDKITRVEVIALCLSVLWMIGTVVFFLVLEPKGVFDSTGGALNFVMVFLAVFLPVAVIWVAGGRGAISHGDAGRKPTAAKSQSMPFAMPM